MSDDHLEFLRKLFPTALVINAYGMTEISGATLLFNPFADFEMIKVKGKSVGKPLPGIWLKVLTVTIGYIFFHSKLIYYFSY